MSNRDLGLVQKDNYFSVLGSKNVSSECGQVKTCLLVADHIFSKTATIDNLDISGASAPAGIASFVVNPSLSGEGFYSTIQDALDAAQASGSTNPVVYVTAGTYAEDVVVDFANAKIQGVSPSGCQSTSGSVILGQVVIDAPNVELNSLVIQSPVDRSAVEISPLAAGATFITECHLIKNPAATDATLPVLDVVGPVVVHICRSSSTTEAPATGPPNGGVNVRIGAGATIEADHSRFVNGTIEKNNNLDGDAYRFCESTVTYTSNQTVNGGGSEFLHCRLTNNALNGSTTPIFAFDQANATT